MARTNGGLIAANREYDVLPRRVPYAHEYCYVLVDRAQRGLVSRGQDRDELREVRANAFAASLLMAAESVRQFIARLRHGAARAGWRLRCSTRLSHPRAGTYDPGSQQI